MILVFDTETTTFPSASLPANHPNQARIVQLAWILLDEQYKERACFNSLIKIPESVRISEGAKSAHGITEEDCRKHGVSIVDALKLFVPLFSFNTTVAHNIRFDNQMLAIEAQINFNRPVERLNIDGLPHPLEFCTMEAMTPLCQLPFKNGKKSWGGQKYKWPTLQEAHEYCFGEKFEGAHDALADVRATARIYQWLQNHNKLEKNICPQIPTLTT